MDPLELELADGWKEVDPHSTAFALAFLFRGGLRCQSTDFQGATDCLVPPLGKDYAELNCPIAVDHANTLVYWSHVETRPESSGTRNKSRFGVCSIIEFAPRTGTSRRVCQLPQGKIFNWLLEFDSHNSRLISQIHTDNPANGFELGLIDIASGSVRPAKIDQECWSPIAAYPEHEQVLVNLRGGGLAFIDLNGAIIRRCPEGIPDRDASLHPKKNLLAAAGRGIFLLDMESNAVRQVANSGEEVRWSPDGERLWYQAVDSELYALEFESRRETCVIRLKGGNRISREYTHAVTWSPDGRFLLAQMTRKSAVSPAEERKRRKKLPAAGYFNSFDWDHYLCITDTRDRTVWIREGYASKASWFSSSGVPFFEGERPAVGI